MPTPDRHVWSEGAAVFALLAAALLTLVSLYAWLGPAAPHGVHARPPDTAYLIPINTASAADLQLLPGVGPTIAARIVEERRVRPFTDVDDLSRVKGIGPKLVERMGPYVTFADVPRSGPQRVFGMDGTTDEHR